MLPINKRDESFPTSPSLSMKFCFSHHTAFHVHHHYGCPPPTPSRATPHHQSWSNETIVVDLLVSRRPIVAAFLSLSALGLSPSHNCRLCSGEASTTPICFNFSKTHKSHTWASEFLSLLAIGKSSVEIKKSIALRFFFHSKKRPTRRLLNLDGKTCMYPRVDNDDKSNICERSRSLILSGLELAPRFFKVARKDSKEGY